MFSVCPQGGGGTSRYLPPGQGSYPSPSRSGWGRGTPSYLPPIQVRTGGGYPKVPTPVQVRMGGGSTARYLPPIQVRMGGTARYLPPSQGTYPPPRDRTAYGVLDTLRSVCLLRSRRRTFLLLMNLFLVI